MANERTDEDDRRHAEVVDYIVRNIRGADMDGELERQLFQRIDVESIFRVVADAVLELITEEGFCTYGWHVSEAEFFADGRCEECGEQREHANHRTVLVCVDGQDPPVDAQAPSPEG